MAIDIIMDLQTVSRILYSHFGDKEKVALWLNTKNPLLGDQIPWEMIYQGRTEKLIDFITTSLEGNKP